MQIIFGMDGLVSNEILAIKFGLYRILLNKILCFAECISLSRGGGNSNSRDAKRYLCIRKVNSPEHSDVVFPMFFF